MQEVEIPTARVMCRRCVATVFSFQDGVNSLNSCSAYAHSAPIGVTYVTSRRSSSLFRKVGVIYGTRLCWFLQQWRLRRQHG